MNTLQTLVHSQIDPTLPLHSRAYKMHNSSLFVKRDDELGFGISGSKLRKYSSLLPILEREKKEVALVGSAYSNHILSLVQLLKERGLSYHLFLEKPHADIPKGNFFFLSLLTQEKEITWLDQAPSSLSSSWKEEQENALQKDLFWIEPGACMKEALPGALTLALDILDNEKALGLSFSRLYVDAGTGLTAIALLLGFAFLKKETEIRVLLLAEGEEEFRLRLSLFHSHLQDLLQLPVPFPSQYKLFFPKTAKSFGSCNQTILQTIIKTAREEGLFLDPLYSSKLFFTISQEQYSEPTLWIHSGGALSLTGFQEPLLRCLAQPSD